MDRSERLSHSPSADALPDQGGKKHRYSAFFGTDLDIILREWGVDTVIILGTTTENCCHATGRDAMFRNYRVVFLSDATDYGRRRDLGQIRDRSPTSRYATRRGWHRIGS